GLGTLYEAGAGVERDLGRAAALLKQGCDLGNPPGCAGLAMHLMVGAGVAADPVGGLTYLEKACDQSLIESCWLLGEAYWSGGPGVPRDPKRAARFLQKACDAGVAASCSTWGLSFAFHPREGDRPSPAVQADDARALALFRNGCDGGDPKGCNYLASLYRYGTGVAKDMDRYRALAKKSCDAGYKAACDELARTP